MNFRKADGMTEFATIYGAAEQTLTDLMEFQVSRLCGFTPSAWEVLIYEDELAVLLPLASCVEEKEAIQKADLLHGFERAVGNALGALQASGMEADQLEGLQRAEALFAARRAWREQAKPLHSPTQPRS